MIKTMTEIMSISKRDHDMKVCGPSKLEKVNNESRTHQSIIICFMEGVQKISIQLNITIAR